VVSPRASGRVRGAQLGVAVPPACDYLPALLLPDLARARRLARVALWLDGHAPAHADLGQRGLLADETAAAFADAGCTAVFVADEPQWHSAFGLLCDALRVRGLAVSHPGPGEDPVGALDAWWAEATGAAAPSAQASAPGPAPGGAWPELLLTLPGEAPPHAHGVSFERQSGRLVRRGAGRTAALDAGVATVQLRTYDEWIASGSSELGAHDACALWLGEPSAEAAGAAELMQCAAELVRRVGAGRFRLALPRRLLGADARCGGAPWAARLGLERAELQRQLRVIAGFTRADQLPLLEAALEWQALGVDPLEELYAGRGLPERNADMLVNIVP
jgi:hypothetical protein